MTKGQKFLVFFMVVILFSLGFIIAGAERFISGRNKETTQVINNEKIKPASYEYNFNGLKFVIDRVGEDIRDAYESEQKIRITGYDGGSDRIIIPEEIEGRKVYKVGNAAFYKNEKITYLEIPYTVEEIDNFAFYRCTNLKTVIFKYQGNNPLTIKHSAFYGCISIESLNFDNFNLKIGSNAFAFCTSLSKVTFKESCFLKIDQCAFRNTAVEVVNVPKTAIEIKSCAFANCYNLKEFNVPDFCKADIASDVTQRLRTRAVSGEKTNKSSGLSKQNTADIEEVTTRASTVQTTTLDTASESGTSEPATTKPETTTKRKTLIRKIYEYIKPTGEYTRTTTQATTELTTQEYTTEYKSEENTTAVTASQ